MSTKTTFKRIALVTVAALGFGVLAIVPSQAAVQATNVSLSATTSAQLTSETSTATAAVVTLNFLAGTAASDSASVTAFLLSAPAGNTKLPILQVSETANALVSATTNFATPLAVGAETASKVFVAATGNNTSVTAKFKVYMDATTKAGTYIIKLVPGAATADFIDTTGVNLTITVATNPATDTVVTSATSILQKTTDTTTAVDQTITSSRTVPGSQIPVALIKTSFKNAAAVATSGESFTASVTSGPGLLGSAPSSNSIGGSPVGRAITVKSGDYVTVFPDGNSGVSVISIKSALGVELSTETLTFYGPASAITATVVNAVIGTAPATSAASIFVTLTDSTGTNVSNVTTMYVTSDATTVIPGTYSVATVAYDSTDKGYYVDLTGLAAGTANITVGTKASSTATTGIEAAKVAIRVGGGATKLDDVKVEFDKTSYLPGELAVIKVTPIDSAGLVLAPDTYTVFATGGIVAPVAITGAVITAITTQDGGVAGSGTGADSVATYKIYMPAYQGTFVFKYTTGTFATLAKSAVARTISVAVIGADGGAKAAADEATAAAEEATAAANDATDAALSAAEAAEAATAMAQEAVDAVAELSAQVTSLISALRAQITALTNLVIKIQKKVKA
jgi:hypothetical protein